jgi:hypothetical protein
VLDFPRLTLINDSALLGHDLFEIIELRFNVLTAAWQRIEHVPFPRMKIYG